jgi:hypothetical protein
MFLALVLLAATPEHANGLTRPAPGGPSPPAAPRLAAVHFAPRFM